MADLIVSLDRAYSAGSLMFCGNVVIDVIRCAIDDYRNDDGVTTFP